MVKKIVEITATMPKKKFALFELSLLMITGVLELVECCGRSVAGTGTGAPGSTGGSGAIWLPGGFTI